MAKPPCRNGDVRYNLDPRTILITKRIFCILMRGASVDEELLHSFEVDLGSISETERTIVKKVSDNVCEVINSSDQAKVECSVQDFKRRQWNIHSANVHMEFNKVVAGSFKDDEVNWGRVIGFLAFAVSFAVYTHRLGMSNAAVESIHGWTVQVIEHSIQEFFNKNGRWEGLLEYTEVLLRKLRRPENGREPEPFWHSAVAFGVLGLGAAAAFTLRQALS